MTSENDRDDRIASDVIEALQYAAAAILLELAEERGKGSWFPALMSRLQRDIAMNEIRKGRPESGPDRSGVAVHEVFRRVLEKEGLLDFRQMAAVSGTGRANPLLADAVVAGLQILARAYRVTARERPDAEEFLGHVRAKAIGDALVQNIPSDADGILKDRWIGASMTAIEAALGEADD